MRILDPKYEIVPKDLKELKNKKTEAADSIYNINAYGELKLRYKGLLDWAKDCR